MNRRRAMTIISGAAVAGVLSTVGVTAAVAGGSDDTEPSASVTEPVPTETSSTTTPDPTPEPDKPEPTVKATTTAPAKFSIANLPEISDLVELGYPVDAKDSTRGEGDGQVAITPCLEESLSGQSGDRSFTGAFTGNAGSVDISITKAKSADAAIDLGEALEGSHTSGCGGNGNAVTVSAPHHTELDDGFTSWLDVVVSGGEGENVSRVGIVVVGDRVALVSAMTKANGIPAFEALLERTAERLR